MKFITISLILTISSLFTNSEKEQVQQINQNNMKVAVWDTYVEKKNGDVMHFDILAPEEIKDTTIIYNYGKDYLKSKGQEGQSLSSKECRLCHMEQAIPEIEASINKIGYYIIEMQNCN